MNKNNTPVKTWQEKDAKVEGVYKKAVKEISELNSRKRDLAALYVKKLEQKKIEEIRKSISE